MQMQVCNYNVYFEKCSHPTSSPQSSSLAPSSSPASPSFFPPSARNPSCAPAKRGVWARGSRARARDEHGLRWANGAG